MLLRNLEEVQSGDQNKHRDRFSTSLSMICITKDTRRAFLEMHGLATHTSRNGLCFIPHAQALSLLVNCPPWFPLLWPNLGAMPVLAFHGPVR